MRSPLPQGLVILLVGVGVVITVIIGLATVDKTTAVQIVDVVGDITTYGNNTVSPWRDVRRAVSVLGPCICDMLMRFACIICSSHKHCNLLLSWLQSTPVWAEGGRCAPRRPRQWGCPTFPYFALKHAAGPLYLPTTALLAPCASPTCSLPPAWTTSRATSPT
jgi:hypothetical protein